MDECGGSDVIFHLMRPYQLGAEKGKKCRRAVEFLFGVVVLEDEFETLVFAFFSCWLCGLGLVRCQSCDRCNWEECCVLTQIHEYLC